MQRNLQNPSDSGKMRKTCVETTPLLSSSHSHVFCTFPHRMDYGKMDTESLNGMLLDRINRLARDGVVDDHFLQLHSLKADSGPSFFLELILVFLTDARTVMNDMLNILSQQGRVDYKNLHLHYIKLKGSSACFGALRITDACSHLRLAIQNNSKEGCLQALHSIRGEYNSLHDQLYTVIKIEREIISRVTGNR